MGWTMKAYMAGKGPATGGKPKGNAAAQVDNQRDEYGGGAPKFKAGDTVKITAGEHAGAIGTLDTECAGCWFVSVPVPNTGGFFHKVVIVNERDISAVAPPANDRPCIVALMSNGQPLPSSVPRVHKSLDDAKDEAARLAEKHPGKSFGIYELTHSAKVKPRHEWQRLAADGKKDAAVLKLMETAGLGGGSATYAVNAFMGG